MKKQHIQRVNCAKCHELAQFAAVSGSGGKGKKREQVFCRPAQSLAVSGHRAGVETPNCSNEVEFCFQKSSFSDG